MLILVFASVARLGQISRPIWQPQAQSGLPDRAGDLAQYGNPVQLHVCLLVCKAIGR